MDNFSRKKFVTFQNSKELIDRFRGKVLIQQNYRSDPELYFYVGDMISGSSLTYALGEVESREADFTKEGLEFLEYAFAYSDIEKILSQQFYRPDYVKDGSDLLAYEPLAFEQKKSERNFCAFIDPDDAMRISRHLGLDFDSLYPSGLRNYDSAYKQSLQVFDILFKQDGFFTGHGFDAHKKFQEKYTIYYKTFKKVGRMLFCPIIYIQDIRDGKGGMLNRDRETFRVCLLEEQYIKFDYLEEHFQEKMKKFFLQARETVNNLYDHCSKDIEAYIKKSGLSYSVLRKGELWNDQWQTQNKVDIIH